MHKIMLILVMVLGLTGCEDMARAVVKMHGVKVDPFPGPGQPSNTLQSTQTEKRGRQ